MRPGGGKAKGSKFERRTCKELSLWVSHGKRDDLFWRSAMSGGRASVAFKKGKKNQTQVGDITAIDKKGEKLVQAFVVECKHLQNLGLTEGFLKGTGEFIKIWRKLLSDCLIVKRAPMLIARQNKFPTILITSFVGCTKLGLSRVGDDPPLVLASFGELEGVVPAYVYLYDEVLKKRFPL